MNKNILLLFIFLFTSCSNFWNDRVDVGIYTPEISFYIINDSYQFNKFSVNLKCFQDNPYAIYRLYYAVDDYEFSFLKELDSDGEFKMDLELGRTYKFKAQSYYNKNISNFSNCIDVKVSEDRPENLELIKIDNSNHVKLTWDPVAEADYYKVYIYKYNRYYFDDSPSYEGTTERCEFIFPQVEGTIKASVSAHFNNYDSEISEKNFSDD